MNPEDPAVQGWHAATESTMSTSSTARRLEAELEQARRAFNFELSARVDAEWERDEALHRLSQALSACDELSKTHAVAILENNRLLRENERLRVRIERGSGRYWLTDKGMAVTEGER